MSPFPHYCHRFQQGPAEARNLKRVQLISPPVFSPPTSALHLGSQPFIPKPALKPSSPYPDGYHVTYTRHPGSVLLHTVVGSDFTRFAECTDYGPSGKIGALDHANGVISTYTYDPYTHRLSDLVTVAPPDIRLQDQHYTYNRSGDITHSYTSGYPNVSKFSKGAGVKDIKAMVNEAAARGEFSQNKAGSTITHDFGRTIGTKVDFTSYFKIGRKIFGLSTSLM